MKSVLVMRTDWKESKAQLYGPLAGTHSVMEFVVVLKIIENYILAVSCQPFVLNNS